MTRRVATIKDKQDGQAALTSIKGKQLEEK